MNPDPATTVLYALTTIAQTLAALAAFVGAVGIFRLQAFGDRRREAELETRRRSNGLTNRGYMDLSWDEVVAAIENPEKPDHPNFPRAKEALREWRAFAPQISSSRWWLIAFEVWNLATIGLALIGFGFVKGLAACPILALALLWLIAIGTVAVTLRSVVVWTKG